MRRRFIGLTLACLGLVAGALAGALVAGLAGAAVQHRAAVGSPPRSSFIEATHVPPLLTASGERIDVRYDVYCGASDDEDVESGSCPATGSVFVRAGDSGGFREIPLASDGSSTQGRFVAHVPDDVARSRQGFSYYATVRSVETGATTTIPAGGAIAPQRSLPLGRSIDIDLGTHVFGATTDPEKRVAAAAWGNGPSEPGLERGQNLMPMGGSSFDVAPNGTVSVLDEAHRRVLRWRADATVPESVPVAVNGTLADLAVASDGSMYVLESTAEPGRSPLLRAFSPTGRDRASARIAERMASQVRIGPTGPVALEQPSGSWMPIIDGGAILSADSQRLRGTSGRPLAGGDEVVVFRTGNEIRAAIAGPRGVRRSWRITSDTPLGEVQLAEPLGTRLVVVFRVYTDSASEFVALAADQRGVARELSLGSAAWAETAPLSRFRLRGSSLYRLGSTSHGLYVDRYSLEVM